MSQRSVRGVRPLLFFSGLCALVYQVAWTRELRLVFGASSASSAAVLGVFMGGLGVGGIVLGARAESAKSPLRFYAHLEIVVAVASAFTPLLVRAARAVYLATGGQATLGLGGATVARLALSVLVLGVPTVAMGGTLPAAARAISSPGDTGRRAVAGLYAANTFGAVTGALLANFVLLEVVGTRLTLWMACLVNVLVGVLARARARSMPAPAAEAQPIASDGATRTWARLAFAVAAGSGFAFLMLELVWYRMLSPLLGGSSYTFGLILAVALAGIAIGGAIYARRPRERAALPTELALTCALEALAIAAPFALGDRVAELALLLRPLGAVGFYGHVAAWTVVVAIVVVPAAIVSGYQFPLLVALLGRTSTGVARDVGRAYAWNTAGSIAGSVLAGFVLLPRLGAEQCWTGAVVLFALLAFAAVVVARAPGSGRLREGLAALGVACLAALALRATGPTAAWRHSPIGAGRMDAAVAGATKNSLRGWMRDRRREILWQQDGVESSVAARVVDDYAFLMNGRADGSARTDAGTQIMSALIGALLVPETKTALVVGLGTGCTAGWLAKVPGMERVDVVELEPAMKRVARELAAVNQDVMNAPNVHLTIGDAREVLQTTRARYDVVFSEPSNPYRAGISSLYTRDFYEDASARLRPGGVFVQWLQLYDVDGVTVRTAIATLHAVLPHVSLWESTRGDLILVASKDPVAPTLALVRERVAEEPFATAMRVTWGVSDAEGFLAHHIGSPDFANAVAASAPINTDDVNLLEYAFARNIGGGEAHIDDELWARSTAAGMDLPAWARGVDLGLIERRRMLARRETPARLRPDQLAVEGLFAQYENRELARAAATVEKTSFVAQAPIEGIMIADIDASLGTADARDAIERVRAMDPGDAHALDATLAWKQGDGEGAVVALEAAFDAWRVNPWADVGVQHRALELAVTVAAAKPWLAKRLFDSLVGPFAVYAEDASRRDAWRRVAEALDGATGTACRVVFHAYEPWTPWQRSFLRERAACYARAPEDALLGRAKAELAEHVAASPAPLVDEP